MSVMQSTSGWVIAPVAILLVMLVVLTAWWVSAPARALPRWLFRALVLLMISALALPAALVLTVRDWLSWLVPLAREISDGSMVSVMVHFGLFVVVSGLLLHIRRDLPLALLAGGLVVLAGLMELVQLWVDGRFASWLDFAVNLAGVVTGLVAVLLLHAVLPARNPIRS